MYSREAGCSGDIQPPLTDSFSVRGTAQPERLLGFSDQSSHNGGKADHSGLLPGLSTSCRGSELEATGRPCVWVTYGSPKGPETLEEEPLRIQKVPPDTMVTWSCLKSFQGAPIKAKAFQVSSFIQGSERVGGDDQVHTEAVSA